MKQYRASASSVETNMITLQDQAVSIQKLDHHHHHPHHQVSIQKLEMERDAARETSSELRVRVAELESAAKEGLEAREREKREGDLGRRLEVEEIIIIIIIIIDYLEVEETSRRRAETKLARLTEEVRYFLSF